MTQQDQEKLAWALAKELAGLQRAPTTTVATNEDVQIILQAFKKVLSTPTATEK